MNSTRSPANIRIENRQGRNRIIWSSEPWKFRRLLFLLHPANKGGCVWCGQPANTVCHPGTEDVYRKIELYLDFRKAGCYPMCSPCNNAERQNKILCPRCRQQGHYVPAGRDGKGDGAVCWSCKPEEEKQRLKEGKECRKELRRNLERNKYWDRTLTSVINPKTGRWVKVPR